MLMVAFARPGRFSLDAHSGVHWDPHLIAPPSPR